MPPFVIATVPRLALRKPPPREVKPGVQWTVLIQGHEVAVDADDRDNVAADLTLTPISSDDGRIGAGASARTNASAARSGAQGRRTVTRRHLSRTHTRTSSVVLAIPSIFTSAMTLDGNR